MKILTLILGYFGFQLVFTIAACIGFYIFTGSLTANLQSAATWGMLFFSIVLCIYLYCRKEVGENGRDWSLPDTGKMIPIALGLTCSAILLAEEFHKLVPLPDLMEETFTALSSTISGVICVAAIGPVAEEFFFRGTIMKYFLKRLPPAKAILFSSFIFGLIHLNPVQIFFAFVFGMLLGWTYYKTGSLIYPVLMHIANNSITTILSIRYPKEDYISEIVGYPAYYVLIALACITFATCFVALKKTVAVEWKAQDNPGTAAEIL